MRRAGPLLFSRETSASETRKQARPSSLEAGGILPALCVFCCCCDIQSSCGQCRVHRALLVSSSLHRAQGTQTYVQWTFACLLKLSISWWTSPWHAMLSVGHLPNAGGLVLSPVTRPMTLTSHQMTSSCPGFSIPAEGTTSHFLSQACNFCHDLLPFTQSKQT